MFGEEAPALRQGHRMGEDAIDVSDRGTGNGNQIVADAKERLTLHCDVVGQQQVEVFSDRTGKAVFNWNDSGIHFPVGERSKDVGGEGKGNDYCIGVEFHCCFVAERAGFTLDRNSHSGALLSCCNVCGEHRGGIQLALAFWHHTIASPRTSLGISTEDIGVISATRDRWPQSPGRPWRLRRSW